MLSWFGYCDLEHLSALDIGLSDGLDSLNGGLKESSRWTKNDFAGFKVGDKAQAEDS